MSWVCGLLVFPLWLDSEFEWESLSEKIKASCFLTACFAAGSLIYSARKWVPHVFLISAIGGSLWFLVFE
ncbi:MAG: hypothetical protein AAF226_18690, partial [Verrucomicrobiota bacterium]